MKGSGAEKAEKHQLGRRVTLHFRQRPPSNNGCWTAISDEPHDKQKSGRANGRLLAVKMNAVNGKLGPIRSELFHICRKDNLRSIVLRSLLILSIIDSVMFKTKTNTDWESLMIKTTYYCIIKINVGVNAWWKEKKKTTSVVGVDDRVCLIF